MRADNVAVVDTKRLDLDRVLNLEELRAYFSTLGRYVRDREAEAIEKVLRTKDRESKEKIARPLGKMQREAMKRRLKARRLQKSSLREPGRNVAIFTTAALPWMTGTAVNPLLRAAYLARDDKRKVTLVIPWLAPSDQRIIFPNNLEFDKPAQQEEWVRAWVDKRTSFPCNFKIAFYSGRYAPEKMSILPVGDPTEYIPDSEADVAILEEPEHLTWYHHGRRWTDKFSHVVGIIHTNYLDYAQREEGGKMKAPALAVLNDLVCRMHCHKVVKLSDAVQPLARQTTQFVHGVPQSFLAVGDKKSKPREDGGARFSRGAYFIGKAIWAKGYTELLDLMDQHKRRGEAKLDIDCYGSGEDLNEMKTTAAKQKLDLHFHGARDHLDESIHEYKAFVNPSKSDVVATTTAEALAMGKWVIVHDHPSNKFFQSFENCLTYKTPEDFSRQLAHALAHEPHPMHKAEYQRLTWEEATERFLDVTELGRKERAKPLEAAFDTLAYSSYNALTGVEMLRALAGAGINTRDNPTNLIDYVPAEGASGGLFDRRSSSKRGSSSNPLKKAGRRLPNLLRQLGIK
ncbi:hypothetical protein WJX73_004366 [Symbiochloris irregularis]|uniref:digalactosyldiacylglycerol synthase n=1 Tax=Symbiochloris irregularis TaxID=706552 RepID=A0AAW1NM56_9CHLO